jgi:hypothetical protein
MNDRFKKAKKIMLQRFVPAQNFRTVHSELRDLPCGITEIPVTIEFNKNYKPPPPYKDFASGGGFVYGFLRMNEEMVKLNGSKHRKKNHSDVIKHLYLTDWDGAFLLSVVLNQGGEYLYAVSNEEVNSLLENCMHPNDEIDV